MRALLIALLLTACTPAVAAPVPTEDPRIATLTAERDDLWKRIADQAQQIQHPTFLTWSATHTLRVGESLEGGLPDTFTARIAFTATAPVRTRIMTFPQYAAWTNNRRTEATLTYPPTTNLDVIFHDAEGCAGYMVVLDAEQESIVSPHFTITYAPSRVSTGACAN